MTGSTVATRAGVGLPGPAGSPGAGQSADDRGDRGGPFRLRPSGAEIAARQRRTRAPQDTAAGCRERAAADLLAAATRSTDNGRQRLEASAASWTLRADLLQRLDDSFDARARLTATPPARSPDPPAPRIE